jgi:hypothetical protein
LAVVVLIGLTIPLQFLGSRSEALAPQYNPLDVLTDTSDKEQILLAIRYVSQLYGVEDDELIRTIACESGFNNEAIGKAGEIGLAQFMPSTWELWNKKRGTTLEIHRIQNQIDMAAWAFGQGYQRHWTCYVKHVIAQI